MKKADRMIAFVEQLGLEREERGEAGLDPHYLGYFRCFNEQRYYEAHDVLEHLWLECGDEHHRFFKGLIQIAGAFVHLQKQFLRPEHPKDGRRLRPAVRLFHLGMTNLEPFEPTYLTLDVAALRRSCAHLAAEIVAHHFARNPWHPSRAPQIQLLSA